MEVTVYGIPNCDQVRKARRWLQDRGIEFRFHDLRKDGLNEALLRQWIDELGWQPLLNRRSASWRQLPESLRRNIDETTAMKIMLEQPTLIKRPLVDTGAQYHIGFSEHGLSQLFGPV